MHVNIVATLKSALLERIGECQANGNGTYLINIAESDIYTVVVGQATYKLLPVPLE
jgi:hypothetical protein